MVENERMYAPQEVADILNVSKDAVLRWCRDGEIQGVKVGKQWRIPAAQLRVLQAGGRYVIRRPGCTMWIAVDALEEARKERAMADRNVMLGHIIYDSWKEEEVDNDD